MEARGGCYIRRMTLVKTTVPGRPRVLVVNATGPGTTWEQACAVKICEGARAAGVELTPTSPVQPQDFAEFVRLFEAPESQDYNVLLLLAHGWSSSSGPRQRVDLAGEELDWYVLHGLEMQLQDKLVLLCVCEGQGDEAIDTIVRGDHFALMLVGSNRKITRMEAEAFFPRFLSELAQLSYSSIDPDVVALVLGEQNHLANDKMLIYSAV